MTLPSSDLKGIQKTGASCTCLKVNGLSMRGHGSLLESLRQRRVSVAGSGNVLTGSTVLESKGTLSNHFTSVGANNVDTQETVGLRVSDHLDNTFRVQVGLSARVGAKGESTDAVGDLLGLEVLLGLADPGNLGVGVHDGGNAAVVDVAITLLDVLDNGNGLLLSFVGKHRAESGVTDTANVGDLGTVLGVDDYTAALVELHANVLKTETLGVGAAADSNKDNLGIKLLTS